MKNAEAQRNGFERAARHGAHNDGIWQAFSETVDVQSAGILRGDSTQVQANGRRAEAAGGECGGNFARVPIHAIDYEANGRRRCRVRCCRDAQAKEASSRSRSMSPDWKLSPVSSAVTITFAGLKSIGSMA